MKTVIILLLTFSSKLAWSQLDLSFQLLNANKTYNPIPLRDDIPNTLVQAKPANTIIFPVKPVVAAPTKTAVAEQTRVTRPQRTEPVIVQPILAANLKIETAMVEVQNVDKAQVKKEAKIKISLNELQKLPLVNDKKITVLNSPKILVIPQASILQNTKVQKVFEPNQLLVPKISDLEKIPEAKIKPDVINLVKLIDISADEYKLIQALLLYEYQKKLDSAMSLFIDLLNSDKFKHQAMYHYAEIAFQLGLPNEFKSKMMQLSQVNNQFFKKIATESLVKNAVAIAPDDIEKIEPLTLEYSTSFNGADHYLLRRAQYFGQKGDLNRAENSIKQIHPNSKINNSSQLLLSNLYYRQGQLNPALKVLEAQQDNVALLPKTDKIRNLTYLSLARMYFQKGQYKNSYAQYLKVDKSSSFWLQASQEQALTQILFGDHIGAAGNMFSLHTEYFKKAYAPDSYIVRAIGYLNLCQFGDAVSVVADLHRRYSKQYEQILNFKNTQHASADYYNLVKELFNGSQTGDVKNLPRAFVIELARQPAFIATQKQINSTEEEITGFNQIIAGLGNKTTKLRAGKEQTTKLMVELKNNKQNPLLVEQYERQILAFESEIAVLAKGREKIERMRNLAQERMNSEKVKLKVVASNILQQQFKSQFKMLTEIMEQKDVLAYDIYSGAGEHLRYQMAGGETPERNPAAEALTPEEKKSYRWKFRGEVWEDEVGHYRSSLTNVCAKEGIAQNSGGE